MSEQNYCIYWSTDMCPTLDTMHRYTRLVWDSETKTLLGKNGVSWLSIFLGTFVVLLGVGILIQCVRDVKRGRQEADAQMRKILLEKRHSSVAPVNTAAEQVNTFSATPSVPSTTTSLINERLNKTLQNDFESFEYLKERGMLVRKRRSFSPVQAIKKKHKKSMSVDVTLLNSNEAKMVTTESATSSSFGEAENMNIEKPILDDLIYQLPEQSTTFLDKLATAKIERLKRQQSTLDVFEEIFGEESRENTTRIVDNYLPPKKTKKTALNSFLRKISFVSKKTREPKEFNPKPSTFKKIFSNKTLKRFSSTISIPQKAHVEKVKDKKVPKFVGKIASWKMPNIARRTCSYYSLNKLGDPDVGSVRTLRSKDYNLSLIKGKTLLMEEVFEEPSGSMENQIKVPIAKGYGKGPNKTAGVLVHRRRI